MNFIKNIFLSLRPRQWIKNLFVFAALVFVREFNDLTKIKLSVFAFLLFCMASSAVYLINDVVDLPADRLHPTKKMRPLAAGKLRVSVALIVVVLLAVVSLPAAFYLNSLFGLTLLGYLYLNLLYSLWLKKLVIIDVLAIAIGFVLRVVAGALIIQVAFSPWLVFCTFFLALFLSISKRKSEVLRGAVSPYTVDFINQMNMIVLPLTIVTYTFFTFSSEHSKLLMLTVPIVLYGLFRYLYILDRKRVLDDGPTDDFYSDYHLQFTVACWIVVIFLILYFLK